MKNYIKIGIVTIIILAIASLTTISLTGFAVNKYEYTTAICDGNNFCQDHLITCENDITTKITPITGASVQNSKEWVDPREELNSYCE